MMKVNEFIARALDCGASKATVIDASAIVLSEEFIKICAKNGCGNYGRCHTCPDDDCDIQATIAEIRSYDQVLWYQTIGEIEDSFDYEGMCTVSATHSRNCQAVHSEIANKMKGRHLHLSCGGCQLCESCAKIDGKPCRYPEKALPAMEGWGVDVYNTTKETDLKYINGQNTVTYFGMLLFTADEYV